MLSLFEQVGGRETLVRVHKIFYDKAYADPWLGQFFQHVEQEIIENQQTDFMTRAMGGPPIYCGRLPVATHKNMYITTELFDHRHAMLADSIAEAGVSEHLRERWLRIDGAFRGKLTKRGVSECQRRFATDDLLVFDKPGRRPRKELATSGVRARNALAEAGPNKHSRTLTG